MNEAMPNRPREEDRATTTARKQTFARNVNRLAAVLGVSQRQAAERIGVPYKWLWRMAQTGISRIDERNLPNLEKVAAYFLVPSTDDFWREGLLYWLIASDEGCGFVKKFRDELREMYRKECQKDAEIDRQLLNVVRKYPDHLLVMLPKVSTEVAPMTREEKLAELAATGKYDKLRELDVAHGQNIDESYEREFGDDKTRKRKVV
jgi:hypothetical protein